MTVEMRKFKKYMTPNKLPRVAEEMEIL